PRALLALLAIGIVGVLGWFFLLKPSVESAAKEALADPLEKQNAQLAAQTAQLAQQGKAIEKLTGSPLPPVPNAPSVFENELGNAFDTRLFTTRTTAQGPGSDSDQNSYVVPQGTVLSITDFVLSSLDATGDSGIVTIARGSQTILQLRLENFRDIDYHFVAPIKVIQGQRVRLSVTCENAGAKAADPCNVALYFSGYLRT
ncbi:MAG: hypothetical protein ACRD1T_11440, partial [Acidimicrobiia bacterium]